MSTTYYLSISGGADVLLVDSGGTILAYQEGSSEGPGGTTTYTISPVFDTALFDMPTDVQVWYSNDGTNFAYSPAWITSRTGDTITVTVASSTTVTAKLYYASGTVVTDENGAEVASVSTVIGGVATTIGTVTVAGSTTPTEGVAETYSATISGNATDQTYLWATTDVGATIATPTASSTNITFSTSGPFNVTCTVSSATASDSPQADTLGVTVAAAANDWDTFEVARSGSITFSGTTYQACTFSPTSSTDLDLVDDCRMAPGIPTLVQLRDIGGGFSALNTEVPYLAMWRAADSEWFVLPFSTATSASVYSYDMVISIESRSGTGSLTNSDTCIIVGLSAYTSGDVTGWSDYVWN